MHRAGACRRRRRARGAACRRGPLPEKLTTAGPGTRKGSRSPGCVGAGRGARRAASGLEAEGIVALAWPPVGHGRSRRSGCTTRRGPDESAAEGRAAPRIAAHARAPRGDGAVHDVGAQDRGPLGAAQTTARRMRIAAPGSRRSAHHRRARRARGAARGGCGWEVTGHPGEARRRLRRPRRAPSVHQCPRASCDPEQHDALGTGQARPRRAEVKPSCRAVDRGARAAVGGVGYEVAHGAPSSAARASPRGDGAGAQ